MIKLKPCPFCGGEEAHPISNIYRETTRIKCAVCEATTRERTALEGDTAYERAARDWNRRTKDTGQEV